MLALWIE